MYFEVKPFFFILNIAVIFTAYSTSCEYILRGKHFFFFLLMFPFLYHGLDQWVRVSSKIINNILIAEKSLNTHEK